MELYTLNVANTGKRGRPSIPKPHAILHEKVLNSRKVPLGDLILEPQSDGSVKLKAVVNGKAKVFSFPAVKGGKAIVVKPSTYVRKAKTTRRATKKVGVRVVAARKRTIKKAA